MIIHSLRWNNFLQYEKSDWNDQKMRDIIHNELDECVKEGYRQFLSMAYEDPIDDSKIKDIKTNRWNSFLERFNDSDWNTPEIRYEIKQEFDSCAEEGFVLALDEGLMQSEKK